MTAELISSPSRRLGAGWAGRASHLRRQQVRSRESEQAARVQKLWDQLVEVLRDIDTPTSAVLCTAGGAPVAIHGLGRADLVRAAQVTGSLFAEHASPAASAPGAVPDAVELSADGRTTVIACVSGDAAGDHLLSVTAEGVSAPLLHAWTRRAAADLGEVLSAQS
ncbi:hypothetical protein [Nocardioides renjunii]|uniref:hypothetical protein n=1 Tax=Nocardioides renjunii TaxID=3095075 RepID=UPI002AFF6D03|nr:hypothetical protein [Nocardioides sp. S-34]WQQ23712.1 hypothetical protein SHK17_06915 [Nocardioides sp. S-34]